MKNETMSRTPKKTETRLAKLFKNFEPLIEILTVGANEISKI